MSMTFVPRELSGRSEVAAAWRAGDDDQLAALLGQIDTRSSPLFGELGELISILEQTGSPRVRAAVAMALADLKASEAVTPLVAVLRRPELAKASGTLIFALGELGGSLPLDLAVSLIEAGSFEARAEVLELMGEGRITPPAPAEIASARQRLEVLAMAADPEIAEAAQMASDCLDDAT
jgi:hypothetical protein